MSRKRRIFDVAMPEEDPVVPVETSSDTFPAGKDGRQRRGPMAAAISETVQSARERQDIDARIRAENDALAHEYVRLQNLGFVIQSISLDKIDADKLTRDRAKSSDPELVELTRSIQAIGLSNPIRLEMREDGRYELIQGFRRLSAYRALFGDGQNAEWAQIPAVVAQSGNDLETLYRQMVDENLVRKDISFAEMAQLALDYAADPQTKENDPEKVVSLLFKSSNYQKRSYIRSFIKLLNGVGAYLDYAPSIPRALGLALVSKIEQDGNLVVQLRNELSDWTGRSESEELEVLRRLIGDAEGAAASPGFSSESKKSHRAGTAKAKTSFQIDRREGRAKCVAANGRLEIRLDRDFSVLDRRKLEQAVKLMLDQFDT